MILSTEKNVKFLFEFFFISKEDTVIMFDIAISHDAVLKLTSEKLCLFSQSCVLCSDFRHVCEQRWGALLEFIFSSVFMKNFYPTEALIYFGIVASLSTMRLRFCSFTFRIKL